MDGNRYSVSGLYVVEQKEDYQVEEEGFVATGRKGGREGGREEERGGGRGRMEGV